MQQTPAAILVLSASVLGYAAFSAKSSGQHQASAAFVLAAIVVGLWGMISLLAATMHERASLLESKTRLDLLDQLLNAPVRALRRAARSFADLEQQPRSPRDNREAVAGETPTAGDYRERVHRFERRRNQPPKPPRVA